jgi:hypothetical protein
VSIADWTPLASSASTSAIARGPTTGIAAFGGSFCYCARALAAPACAGLFTNQTNFAPTPALGGGTVTIALRRERAGLSPFAFTCASDATADGDALLVGLAEDGHLVVQRGVIASGLSIAAPGVGGVIARSAAAFPLGTWQRFKLGVVANRNGDVLLFPAIDTGTPSAPIWTPIGGIDRRIILDRFGVAFGVGKPRTEGFAGYAFVASAVGGVAAVDSLAVERTA